MSSTLAIAGWPERLVGLASELVKLPTVACKIFSDASPYYANVVTFPKPLSIDITTSAGS